MISQYIGTQLRVRPRFTWFHLVSPRFTSLHLISSRLASFHLVSLAIYPNSPPPPTATTTILPLPHHRHSTSFSKGMRDDAWSTVIIGNVSNHKVPPRPPAPLTHHFHCPHHPPPSTPPRCHVKRPYSTRARDGGWPLLDRNFSGLS